jgi:hypothetical protein
MAYTCFISFCYFLSSKAFELKYHFCFNDCIFKQHDKISCLCTFLFASLKQECNYNESIGKNVLFNLNDLKIVIQSIAMRGFFRTLLNSLKIFIPVRRRKKLGFCFLNI